MRKMWKYCIGIGLATLSLGSLATFAISCSSTKNVDSINQDVVNYYNNFLNQNRGRWAGNLSNYNNVKSDNTGLESNAQPKYTLETELTDGVNNYGTRHAYLWLKNEIVNNLKYTDKNPDVADIAAATINTSAQGDNVVQVAANTVKLGNVIYGQNNIEQSQLTKTGLLTQPFLWNGRDRANGIEQTYNNRGNNIVVTINPDEAKENVGTTPYDFFIVAHYDSTATGAKKESWGATDNATGVAQNLALLKYFSNENNRKNLKTRLHVVFVDAEEMGKLGSNAFVGQFLGTDSQIKDSSWGMINLDTIAGGDYMYVHSPDTSTTNSSYNTTSGLRTLVNNISKSLGYSDDYTLQVHKQYSSSEYKAGETGDWSDHAPFYQNAGIPIAYIESTNFALVSKYDVFDGYSQTINKNAWVTKKGEKVEMLKKTNLSGETIWVLPEGYKYDDFEIKGDIWHNDIDTPTWLSENIGNEKINKQLTVVFETLTKFLIETNPHKIN